MTEPRMRRARGDGVTIQLAEWPGGGVPVLCLHGLSANCRWWDLVAQSLSPAHRVVAMDLRGRGRSDQPPSGYSLDQHGRDIAAVLDDLELERAALMGHSLGAFIAEKFAARHPERVARLVLVDGGGQLSEAQRDKVLAGVMPSVERLERVFPSLDAAFDYLRAALPVRPWLPRVELPYRYDTEEVEGGVRCRVRLAHIQEELANLAAEDASALYAQLRCPVLVLRATAGMLADDDLLLPADVLGAMQRQIPDVRCVDVPANHYTIVFCESAERDRALHDFLSGRS